MSDAFTVDELDWETPSRVGSGRSAATKTLELASTTRAMIPALRQRPNEFAVLQIFEKPMEATRTASCLRRFFKGSEARDEDRLNFRGSKRPEGGSKLYVRLLSVDVQGGRAS